MEQQLVVALIVIVLLSAVVSLVVTKKKRTIVATLAPIVSPPINQAPSNTTAPPATTSAPPATQPPAPLDPLYVDYQYRYGLPPLPLPPPPGWYTPPLPVVPTYELVPGASWPFLVGRQRDTVISFLMTTFPRLVVRAIPSGSHIAYLPRADRITVVYDPATRRVLSARIG